MASSGPPWSIPFPHLQCALHWFGLNSSCRLKAVPSGQKAAGQIG